MSSCKHYAQTARELSSVLPDWDEYTMRRVLRDNLPYTLCCEHYPQAAKAVEVIEKNGGKAELISG